MSSKADVTIKNRTTQELKTHVTRYHKVDKKGEPINEKLIPAESQQTFSVKANTGNNGELDINLIENSSQVIGQLKLKDIKHPKGNIETTSYRDYIKMSAVGHDEDKKTKIRQIDVDIENQTSVTSGWDVVYANQMGVMNKFLTEHIKLISHKGLKISSPELISSSSDKQDIAVLRVHVSGELKGFPIIQAECDLTVNLNSIQGNVKTKGDNLYALTVDFSKIIIEKIELLNIKNPLKFDLPEKEEVEAKILETINEAFSELPAITLDFNFALPVSIEGAVVKLAFVNNETTPERSFLAFLIGFESVGIYLLSEDVIADSEGCKSSVVLSNALIMNYLKNVLITALTEHDIYKGEGFLAIKKESNPLILKSIKNSEEFKQEKGVVVKIDKEGLTSQFSSSKLEIEVDIRYSSIGRMSPWGTLPVILTVSFLAKNDKLELDCLTKMGENKGGLSCVTSKVKEVVDDVIKQLNGEILFPIPSFAVKNVSAPSYIQLSGEIKG
tara:strand:+ start:1293 stop:2792 length:1500 start_codon:yes stop_codon:yes gene_type:complete